MIKYLVTYIILLFVESIVVAGIAFAILYHPLQNEFAIHIKYINFVYLTFVIKVITTNFIALISAIELNENNKALKNKNNYNEIQ